MVRFTFIGRVSDALPLTMSLDKTDDHQLAHHQREAKLILRRLTPSLIDKPMPPRGAIRSGPFCFYYLVDMGVCFLTLCDSTYPRLLAFSMLLEVQKEFFENYSNGDVQSAQRPYALIQFEPFLEKTKRRYLHTRSLRTSQSLAELSERVQEVPVMDIRDVIGADYQGPSPDGGQGITSKIAGPLLAGVGAAQASALRVRSVLYVATLSLLLALVWLYQHLVLVSILQVAPDVLDDQAEHIMPSVLVSYLHAAGGLLLLVVAVSVLRHALWAVRVAPLVALVALALAAVQVLLSIAADRFEFISTHAPPLVLASLLAAAALRMRHELRAMASSKAAMGTHND